MIKKLFNIDTKQYDPEVNWCGPFEYQALITKFLPFHKIFPGINFSCYYHDCRYNLIFTPDTTLKKLLFWKLIVDTIFLCQMFRYTFKTPLTLKYPWIVTFRSIMAVVFYIFVLIMTPVYIRKFKKRK